MTSISAKQFREGWRKAGRSVAFMRITISDMPPSANNLRKSFVKDGKVFSVKSDNYAAWREAAVWEIAAQKAGSVDGPYSLSIAAQRHWRSKRARDIDNLIKPISDALVKAGVVQDDSLAESVSAYWADDLGGKAVIVILRRASDFVSIGEAAASVVMRLAGRVGR